jgi:hypothetical protein
MKYFVAILIYLSLTAVSPAQDAPQAQEFDSWFTEGVMRLDMIFSGTANETSYAFSGIKREKYYSGPQSKLVDPFDYGDHKFVVRDAASGVPIFSQSYCTLYREWQTTTEAQSIRRAYPHVLRFPWPKGEVTVEIHDRDRVGEFQISWSVHIDPASIFCDPGNPLEFETVDLEIHGDASEKVDILFVAEGYTEEEMEKFLKDAKRSAGYIFSEEPFRRVCDVAANAHYDQIYILVNTDKYGGGGIYNHYSISAADNEASRAVVIHEFGHAFGGLADEYFNSSVAYNDFFPLEVEPWNPNLTTLVDFDSKWKEMVGEDIPVPTPGKTEYQEVVGVYEGGGYVAKGVFRPMIDCRMHTNDAVFCPVCSKALKKMIAHSTGE